MINTVAANYYMTTAKYSPNERHVLHASNEMIKQIIIIYAHYFTKYKIEMDVEL